MTEYEEQMIELVEAQLIAQRRATGYLGVLMAITVTLLGLSIVTGVLLVVLGSR